MIGTATASLFGCSIAACPPRLKIPGRCPVRPRLRVGMAPAVAGLNGILALSDVGAEVDAEAVAEVEATAVSASRLPARAPAVTAPEVLRKLRRDAFEFWSLE